MNEICRMFKAMKSEGEKCDRAESFPCLLLAIRTCQKARRDILSKDCNAGKFALLSFHQTSYLMLHEFHVAQSKPD